MRKKTCIFCDNASVTKEHFWPEWLSAYLSLAERPSHVAEFHRSEGKQPSQLERRSERPGAVHSKKIRAVCSSCNSVWMSALEERVKPAILGVLERRSTSIDSPDIEPLTRWIAVKTVVAEHSTDEAVLTVPGDRHALRSQVIPSYFRIFTALHALPAQAAYFRDSTTVSLSLSGPEPPLPPSVSRNIATTSFLVGPLFFYVAAVRVTGLETSLLDPVFQMYRLWPSPPDTVNLASRPPLTQPEVAAVSQTLTRLVQSPRVLYGGPLQR